ncbi:MAG: siroheme synthase CysG [Pseudomonadota bacterium]
MQLVTSQPNKDLSQPRAAEPARMKPLANLPVFLQLENRRVIIVGGSDAAAWKAELLCAAGAIVEVIAPGLEQTFHKLINRATTSGNMTWTQGHWTTQPFSGAALIVADAESCEEAAELVAAARNTGVPINVIDRPEYCDFQFGSIVNRSPLVIGISTNGAAPILGQAVRRRIETLLQPALADWTKIASNIRSSVMTALKPGAERRAFWEQFSDRAFGETPKPDTIPSLKSEIGKIANATQSKGKVTLVGAGPGDAELMTLKAVRALQSADIILFDDLVSDEVLELARREARRMLVGKRGGRKSCRQEDINAMMAKLARAGKQVVRLKSGDPMIFGRAGEEIAELNRHDIPVTVIPGITSALAMASALGVSLTHRDLAQSVRFVTGHSRKGNLPENLDWKAIADPKSTTIFYMGGRTANQIAERLINNGMQPHAPVAVAQSVSQPGQRYWTGSLARLGDCVGEFGYDNPLLIGVGDVFRGAGRLPVAQPDETVGKAYG